MPFGIHGGAERGQFQLEGAPGLAAAARVVAPAAGLGQLLLAGLIRGLARRRRLVVPNTAEEGGGQHHVLGRRLVARLSALPLGVPIRGACMLARRRPAQCLSRVLATCLRLPIGIVRVGVRVAPLAQDRPPGPRGVAGRARAEAATVDQGPPLLVLSQSRDMRQQRPKEPVAARGRPGLGRLGGSGARTESRATALLRRRRAVVFHHAHLAVTVNTCGCDPSMEQTGRCLQQYLSSVDARAAELAMGVPAFACLLGRVFVFIRRRGGVLFTRFPFPA